MVELVVKLSGIPLCVVRRTLELKFDGKKDGRSTFKVNEPWILGGRYTDRIAAWFVWANTFMKRMFIGI